MHHEGNLIITKDNAHEFTNLTSVEGWLEVHADFSAPNLKSVEGWLNVQADFSAPSLMSVWRGLEVRADFFAPSLTSVGCALYVRADFSAPNLTSVGRGGLSVQAAFSAPNLMSVEGDLYVCADFFAPNLTSVEGECITYFKHLPNLRWPVLVTDDYIRIGCQRHLKSRWAKFTDAQIHKMDADALEFWVEHKSTILAM